MLIKKFLKISGFALLLNAICSQVATSKTISMERAITDTAVIAQYKNQCRAAICYSFDDGIKDQFDIAYPLLKKYGFTATFFIIPSQIPASAADAASDKKYRNRITAPQIKIMAENGMEIANHSWTHSKQLTKLSDVQLHQEIDKADSAILQLTGIRPLTFAYPWNAFDTRTTAVVLSDHIAERNGQYGIGSRFTTEAGNRWIDDLIWKRAWSITMIHAITSGFDSLKSPAELDQHFKYVKQHEQEIWVTTFARLTKYMKERDSTTLKIEKKGKHELIYLVSNLPVSIYDEALTIIIPNPGSSKVAKVRQGHDDILFKIRDGNLLVDAQPGKEPVEIDWQ